MNRPPPNTATGTKLTVGRQNPVQTSYDFHADDAVPFDVDALYSYLVARADHQPCGTTDDIVTIFETEFGSVGVVPELVTTTVADRLAEDGIADAPPGDDLKRDALVTLFVDEYSRAFAANPDELPDPRGVALQTTYPDHVSRFEQLHQRLRSLFGSKT